MLIRGKYKRGFIKLFNIILIFMLFTIMILLPVGCEQKSKPDNSVSENNFIQKYFYKRLEGTIKGKGNIVMNLSGKDSALTGNFYFTGKGEPVFFSFNSKIINRDSIVINEHSGKFDRQFNEAQSGTFTGRFINTGRISGNWKDNKTGINYDFSLEEKYPAGSYRFIMKSTSSSYGSRDDGGAYIEYIFPQFTGSLYKSISKLNDKIMQNMIKGYEAGDSKTSFKNFDDEISDFIGRFKQYEKNPLFPKTYKPFWENSFYTSVVYNSDDIIVLENVDFRFEGGAHPNTYFAFYNYNIKTGGIIKRDDIFKPAYNSALDKIGERLFKEQYNRKAGEDLEKAGYFLTDHKFHLNSNFAIFEKGLLFKFNPYEIAAYVYGAPQVFIPYKDLKDLLKDKSVVSGLVK